MSRQAEDVLERRIRILELALDWMWEHLPVDEPVGPDPDDEESADIAAVIEASRKRSVLYDPQSDAEVRHE